MAFVVDIPIKLETYRLVVSVSISSTMYSAVPSRPDHVLSTVIVIQATLSLSLATKLYWQVRKLRAMMSLARLSLKLPE